MPSPMPTRRELIAVVAGCGVSSAVFQRAVVAQAKDEPITEEMVKQAEWISGLKLKPEDRKRLVRSLQGLQAGYAELRKIPLPNSVPPAFAFMPSRVLS